MRDRRRARTSAALPCRSGESGPSHRSGGPRSTIGLIKCLAMNEIIYPFSCRVTTGGFFDGATGAATGTMMVWLASGCW